MDVLFISPGNAKGIYQDLAKDYAAIEPPTWALLLAQSMRAAGHTAGILDVLAERLPNSKATERIKEANPRLICFVVYGQNVNAGTVNMSGAVSLANEIKNSGINIPIAFVGSHVQALPLEVLKDEKSIDIVFTNEGVYALRNLLSREIDLDDLEWVKGIGYRKKAPRSLMYQRSWSRKREWTRISRDMHGICYHLIKNPLISIDHQCGTQNMIMTKEVHMQQSLLH